jgi:hypothetical protein
MKRITITDAMSSSKLFGPFFTGPSWDRWRAVGKAAFGEHEQLARSELTLFREVAGRDPPATRVSELGIVAGRGAGKDSIASFFAAATAVMFDPRTAKLRPGENVFVLCLAVDLEQAHICFNMTKAFFETIPTLKAMVKKIGSDTITLTNRVTIKVTTSSYRSVRGRGILVAIFDECAFWKTEAAVTGFTNTPAANPDVEVHAAISPGLARVPNSMLIMISSAYRRTGMLYNSWKQFYGKPDDNTLVVLGTTTQFNLTFPQTTIDRALLQDRPRYDAEYNSIWRDDLQNLVAREVIEKCVEWGCYERSPRRGTSYFAFIDPAGGSGKDSFTLAIAHMEYGKEVVTIDAIREAKPPFSPEATSKEVADLMLSYGISFCISDKFAGEWVVEQLGKFGIRVEQCAKAKSELYLDLLATLMSGRVELLDSPRAVNQIASLERRNRSGGRPSIDAPVGQHEDVANSIAGAVSISLFKYAYNLNAMGDGDDENDDILAARRLREARLSSHWPIDKDGNRMVNYAHCSVFK